MNKRAMNVRYASVVLLLSSALMLGAWWRMADRTAAAPAADDTRLLVVVAAPPYQAALSDFVDPHLVRVESLLGPTGDVHHLHFTPSQLRRAEAADVVLLPENPPGDPHIWLHSALFTPYIEKAGAKVQAQEAAAAFLEKRTAWLSLERAKFAPLSRVPFIVDHDAFAGLEKDLGLTGKLGALTSGHDAAIGARSLRALRAKAAEHAVGQGGGQKICVLHAPGANTKRIATMLEGIDLTLHEADPMFWNDPSYLKGMQRLVDAFYACLTKSTP